MRSILKVNKYFCIISKQLYKKVFYDKKYCYNKKNIDLYNMLYIALPALKDYFKVALSIS